MNNVSEILILMASCVNDLRTVTEKIAKETLAGLHKSVTKQELVLDDICINKKDLIKMRDLLVKDVCSNAP